MPLKRRRWDREAIMRFKERVRPDPGREFWDGYWDRLQARLAAEPEPGPVPEPAPAAPRLVRRSRPARRILAWAAWPAAAAVLVAAGILIGRWSRGPVAVVPGPETGLRAAGLDVRTGRYLDRSRRILLALTNYTPATKDPYGLDLPGQKAASNELVQEASSLRSDLAKARERKLERLVGDLETILRQIANLEASDDIDAVHIVQAGVAGRDLLFQINLAGLRIGDSRPSNESGAPHRARTY